VYLVVPLMIFYHKVVLNELLYIISKIY